MNYPIILNLHEIDPIIQESTTIQYNTRGILLGKILN